MYPIPKQLAEFYLYRLSTDEKAEKEKKIAKREREIKDILDAKRRFGFEKQMKNKNIEMHTYSCKFQIIKKNNRL